MLSLRENENTAYEKSDWPIGKIGLIFLGTFIFLLVTPLILIWAFPDSLPDSRPRTDDRAAAAAPAGRALH